MMLDLDIGLLRTFTLVAKLNSFTLAGEMLGATQSAVSLRIAKLEKLSQTMLIARTPRSVALTPDGARFLSFAEATLAAHDAAVASLRHDPSPMVIRFAVSDHAVGANLLPALSSLKLSLPGIAPDVMVGSSNEMRRLYDDGEADAAIVRQEGSRSKARPLFDDPLVWAKSDGLDWLHGQPLPLVALGGPCGVKAAAVKALDEANIPWRFAFLGGAVSALTAAVGAGLGVGAFGRRHVPTLLRMSPDSRLPDLPAGTIVLHSRLDARIIEPIASAFKAAGAGSVT